MKAKILRLDAADAAQTAELASAVRAGAVFVFPTDTVYGIGANAFNSAAAARIYAIKSRPLSKPLPILAHSPAAARELAVWTPRAQALAERYWPGPLTLVLLPSQSGRALAGGEPGLGLRVPNHAWLLELIRLAGVPLASTSANFSGQPAISDDAKALDIFEPLADYIVLGGPLAGAESTVADLTGPKPVVLREGAVSAAEICAALKDIP